MSAIRTLDVVIPVYNEAPVLAALFERLHRISLRDQLEHHGLASVRFVFVDDGSSDGTPAFIADKIKHGDRAILLRLSRNFGHQAAVAAGLDHATADFVAVIDADLQDPPELVLDMIKRMDEGFDIVLGQRRNRQEPWYKRLFYWMFYRICSFLAEVQLPVDAGDFCVMRSEVVRALRGLPEKLRFQRGLRSWVGFRQSALLYDRPARALGASKYTWRKLYALATDGIASLSIRPLRITQVFLFISTLVTLAFFGTATFAYLHSDRPDSHMVWFLATQGLIAFTSSLQLFCFYVLGAYVGRMYLEVKARPNYIVMETVTSESTQAS
jgi:glycosyltransferase involved in cell wall biosynthesis